MIEIHRTKTWKRKWGPGNQAEICVLLERDNCGFLSEDNNHDENI